MKSKVILFFTLLVSLFNLSCKSPSDPNSNTNTDTTGFEIISPSQNAYVSGYLTIKLLENKFFEISYIVIKTPDGHSLAGEYLGQSGDTLTYGVDISRWSGEYKMNVEVMDRNNNKYIKQLTINVTQILKYEYRDPNYNITIKFVKTDSKGNVWIVTDLGLFEYSGNTLLTKVPGFDLSDPYIIHAITMGRNDILWLSYEEVNGPGSPSIAEFDGTQIIKKAIIQDPRALTYNSLAVGENDTLYGAGGYEYFAYKDNIWTFYSAALDNYYYYIANDKDFRVWMGCQNELSLLENGTWYNIPAPFDVNYNYFLIDDSSNIWIPIENKFSLARYNGSVWNSINLSPDYRHIEAFDIDKEGNIWVTPGSGILKYNSNGVLLKKFSPGYVHYLKADRNNNIWIQDDVGIMRLNENGI